MYVAAEKSVAKLAAKCQPHAKHLPKGLTVKQAVKFKKI
jgi:hypothetical protein